MLVKGVFGVVYTSRKRAYSFFVAIFTVAVFVIVYFVSFYQPLVVSEPSISVSGDHALLKMYVTNVSGHVIRGADILALMNGQQKSESLEGADGNGILSSGEKVLVEMEVPISSTYGYDVFVNAPFNKSLHLFFELDKSTVNPVTAEVSLSKRMVVGTSYDVIVTLHNTSESDLSEVIWIQTVEGSYFQETSIPRSVAIKSGEYKPLYSTLTPVIPGTAQITFTLRVGQSEQDYPAEVMIFPPNLGVE